MKLLDWNTEYNHLVRWCLRRMTKDSLKSYKDKKEDWIKCLTMLNDFETELFRTLPEIGEEFEIDAEGYSKLCHKYMKKYKNKTTKFFFFEVWTHLRHSVNDSPIDFTSYYKDATKEEIEQARKDFSTYTHKPFTDAVSYHTFSDDAKVLEYRGLRMIIDNEWQDAWIKYKDEVRHFQLIWDWYYPIDEMIDLEMN